MIRIRVLALTTVALLATFAIAATGAQASLFHVEAAGGAKLTGGYPSGGKGEKEALTFSVNGGKTPCFKLSLSGSMAKTAESLTLSATTIGECFAWTMTMGSCDFVLNASGTVTIGGGAACSAKPIEFEPQIGCTIRIGPQNNLAGVSFANKGSGSTRDITATINATGMHYQQMTSFCDGGQGTFVNGTLTGTLTISADQLEGGGQQGLWIE